MKSIFLASALLLAALTNKTFAAGPVVSPVVADAFKSTFINVSDVQWSIVNHLFRAEFENNGEKISAFFGGDGTLVATGRYIVLENLPYALQRSLVRRTVSGSIMEIFEVRSDDQTDYYATVKNNDGQIVLKSTSNTWDVYRKK